MTEVSVIAIHGLGTTTPRTWEYKTRTRPVNWLSDSDMLPAVVPSARIYTFSWNARYYADASVARIENVAEVLLSNLKSQRDKQDTHSRPLIFIASCFGGLIITKALEIANIQNSQYQRLIVANSGIIFLASPLQGTKAGKAAQWQAMLGGILNKAPSQTLLQDLDGSTRALRETSEKFVAMVTRPPMTTLTMCFWESQRTKVLKAVLPARFPTLSRSVQMMIVEEDSACLFGRPKKMLDAPHSMMNKFFGPRDANFILVSDTVREMVEVADEIVVSQGEAFHLYNKHFLVRRRPNPLFTGREDELERLKQALCPLDSRSEQTSRPKIYVIQGMGGAGKSEVAIKFAHDSRPKFWGIFWIDARSEISITNGFAHIARRCEQHDDSLEGTMSWLQNTPHSWLLILDNADNTDLDLDQFLPAGRKGSILITTRLAECAKYHTAGHPDCYERLSQETAYTLLLKACEIDLRSRSDHEEIQENAHAVVDLLGCHALAIIQAGAAVSQGLCDLQEFKKTFEGRQGWLFESFPTQARSEYGGVYATFEVSATYMEHRGDQVAKDALELLTFYAFMHYTDFPEAAFQGVWDNSRDENIISSELNADGEESIYNLSPWHVHSLPAFMSNGSEDFNLHKLRFRKARSLLVSLSLVTFDMDRGTTHMHPVSHFWSKYRLQKQEELKLKAGKNGLCVLSLSVKNPYVPDFDQLRSQLQPHIESIAHLLKDVGSQESSLYFQQSIYRLAWAVHRLKCDSALSDLLQMIPVLADSSWIRTENGQAIQSLHGLYMRDYSDASKAIILLKQVNEIRAHTLPAKHQRYLNSQHNLAKAYLQIEDTIRAIEILERIIHVQKETLRPENRTLLSSQHELARAYMEVEENDKAIALLEKVVEIDARKLRPEHPDLLTSQQVLARAYLKVEENDKAIALLETVVEIEAKTLRSEHPGRLKSQHELARAYLVVEENDKAIALLETVVEIRSRTLRPEHPDRLSSQHVLAKAYMEVEENDKAIALLETVVEIRSRTLRVDHSERVASIFTLAQCHRDVGNYERALQLARSIEEVAQNRGRQRLADWNTELIGYILRDMKRRDEKNMRLEEMRLEQMRLEEVD